jgi:NAD(P)-dependent dehydrogenase (short-subunit alcohol dehydrogenase family)
MRLDGKVALITGVSQYIGPAFTKVFTDAGAIVCVQDRKQADAEQHAAYARKNGELGLILEADLTQPADVDALFRAIDEKFGRIDVLVSNHSIVKSIRSMRWTMQLLRRCSTKTSSPSAASPAPPPSA